jgi:hypothetical protein
VSDRFDRFRPYGLCHQVVVIPEVLGFQRFKVFHPNRLSPNFQGIANGVVTSQMCQFSVNGGTFGPAAPCILTKPIQGFLHAFLCHRVGVSQIVLDAGSFAIEQLSVSLQPEVLRF